MNPRTTKLRELIAAGGPGIVPGATDCVRTGSGGNPFLSPLDSDNYDASIEYYFSRSGFASVGYVARPWQLVRSRRTGLPR